MIKALVLISLLLFVGCGGSPERGDVVGTWTNADGAQLSVRENGQFTGRALPRDIFLWPDKPGPPVAGSGTWTLRKGQAYWEVHLWLHEIDGQRANRDVTVLVAASGPRTYLYRWISEEGGDRYKLERNAGSAK